MPEFEYRDKQGKPELSFSISIPGVLLVPEGKQLSDAHPISREVFESRSRPNRNKDDKPQQDPRDKKISDLTDLLAKLQTDVDKIKTKQ